MFITDQDPLLEVLCVNKRMCMRILSLSTDDNDQEKVRKREREEKEEENCGIKGGEGERRERL